MSRPFLILSLPRSRTAWLAKFLTFGKVRCLHEPSISFSSDDDLREFCTTENQGGADTALGAVWGKIVRIEPMPVITVIRRPRDEVEESCKRAGAWFGQSSVKSLDLIERGLDLASHHPGVRSFAFHDLRKNNTCADIFSRCTGEPLPPGWFGVWCDRKVIADTEAVINAAIKNAHGIAKVYGQALGVH